MKTDEEMTTPFEERRERQKPVTDEQRILANIRAEMARQRVTSLALSEALGVPRSTMASRVSGRTPYRISDLVDIARHLGIPIERFFVGIYTTRLPTAGGQAPIREDPRIDARAEDFPA